MLLVGATHGFIRKPFLGRGFWIGITGSLLAIGLLILSIRFFQKQIPDLKNIFDLDTFAILTSLLIIAGIMISVISTAAAVKKYVKLDQESLYK
jgi:cell division transport system permease protein